MDGEEDEYELKSRKEGRSVSGKEVAIVRRSVPGMI